MEMTFYRLPDGRVVPVDATAAKDAPVIGFTLKGGQVVEAVRLEEQFKVGTEVQVLSPSWLPVEVVLGCGVVERISRQSSDGTPLFWIAGFPMARTARVLRLTPGALAPDGSVRNHCPNCDGNPDAGEACMLCGASTPEGE